MSHETSLALSLIWTFLYAGLFAWHLRHEPGLARTFILGLLLALGAFWLCRSVAYTLLVLEAGTLEAINQVLRWSAYAVALPGVWMLVLEVKRRG